MSGALLTLLVALAVFAVGWYQYSLKQRTDELSRQVSALAKGLAVGDQAAGESTDVRDRLLKVEAGLVGSALFVTDGAGTVQRSTIASPPASLPLDRVTGAGVGGASTGILSTGSGVQVLVVSAPIDSARRLVAVQSLAEIREAQTGLLAVVALALLLAVVVAYVAGGVLARRLTAPLVRLKGAAEQVSAGGFGTQVEEEGDAETASLARSFNEMSTRVADAYAAQKAFVGDVSHEIRTPLTSIRGYAEAMLDGTVSSPEQQERALTVIRDEAVRIGETAQTLLALSELDAGAVQLARDPIDLAVLADALRGRFSTPAAEKNVALRIELGGAARPLGDADRLLQAASTLAANAIAYTPSGGTIVVSCAAADGRWLLTVDDTGPGIPADKRGQVFNRFARLDESRASGSGGAGLGLAICRRLVELMGGSVFAQASELGGARLVIELPLAGS